MGVLLSSISFKGLLLLAAVFLLLFYNMAFTFNKKKVRNLLNNMQEGVVIYEMLYDEKGNPVDFRFIDTNKSFEMMTGLKLKDIRNKTVLEVLPETKSSWIKEYAKAALTGESCNFQEYSEQLGKYFSVNVYSTQKDRFITVICDITDQILTRQLIIRERELFKTTLLSIGDAVISTDINGTIELINGVAEQLTGWSQYEAVGRDFEEVFKAIDEKTGEVYLNTVKRVLETGETVELGSHTLLITRAGSKIPIEDRTAPIKDSDGNIYGVVIVFKDFSEKKAKIERIQYLSYHDQLTGLFNRRFFEEELSRLDTPRNLPLSIIMADVNGLKLTNDVFGHLLGDQLILKAAEVIKKECRSDDIIARIGGDEFTVLLPNTSDEETRGIVNRIRDSVLKESIESISLSISFGYETKVSDDENILKVFKKAEDHMYRKKLFESSNLRSSIIQSIIKSLYDKNPMDSEHVEKINRLLDRFAVFLNFNEDESEQLKSSFLLHDIGKVTIVDNILNKPDRLSQAEWVEVKRHPEIGYRILSSVSEYSNIAEAILAHHENWDGSGYPKGLKGEAIPYMARVLSIFDVYDAMTSERPYRRALTHEDALKEIIRNSGTMFDPQLVKIFSQQLF